MRQSLLAPLVIIAAGFCWTAAAEPVDSVRPITDAKTVIAVYVADWGLRPSGGPKLILAIWPDGHAVWSDSPVDGGAPYHSGQVRPDRVAALLARIEADGYFDNRALTRAWFGPDSSFTTIQVHSGKRQLTMQSWHELYESGGKTVVKNGGVHALDGRRRLDVLAGDSPEFLFYRMAWAELRAWLSFAKPANSTPIDGELSMQHGRITWRERSDVKSQKP